MKRSLNILMLIIILITIFTTALAAEQIELDIDKAVEIAMVNNLNLESTRLDVAIKKRAADLAWNRFIPAVQMSTTMMRWNTEQSGNFLQEEPSSALGFGIYDRVIAGSYNLPRWGLSGGMDISLTLNYALFKEIEGTKIDYKSGIISYDSAVRQLERDVRKNFYNILVFEENLGLMEQNIKAALDRFNQAEMNYKNGLIPELSVLSAQVGYENMKPSFTEMKLAYATMKNRFKILLGIDLETDLLLTGNIEIDPVKLDSNKLTDLYLSRRSDIKSINNSIQSLEIKKSALQFRTMTPMLVLGLNFDPSFNLDPLEDNWFKNMEDNWSQKSGMFRMTLAMSLDSLIPGSPAQAGIKDMEDRISQTKLGLAQARTGAEMEIKTLVMQLNKSREQLQILDLNIRLAEKAYSLSMEAYNAGGRELLEVEDSERDLNNAKLEVLKEKYNYITGLLDLEFALNASLMEIKESLNE